jgi:hypothetical protein
MNVAYVAITVLAAITYAFAAYLSFIRHESVVAVAERVQVPQSWMVPFGGLQAAGALGLLVGLGLPLIGTAAAVGLVLYYLGAVSAHLRVGDRQFGNAAVFLSLAVTTLAVSLAQRGAW